MKKMQKPSDIQQGSNSIVPNDFLKKLAQIDVHLLSD